MNHSDAVRLKAAEQYLFGELGGPLRDEFEEHFMSCAECAADVRAGLAFVESTREVFRLEPSLAGQTAVAPAHAGWLAAFFRPAIAAPALAILLAIAGYQGMVTIPRIKAQLLEANTPRTLPAFSLIAANSRGETPVVVAVQPGQAFALYVDIRPDPSFSLYTCQVESATGTTEFSLQVSAKEAQNTVQILVPPSRLVPGSYVMVVRGIGAPQAARGGGAEVMRSRFSVEYLK
jgi:Putative zinc-finger